jgi:hypothetical protein
MSIDMVAEYRGYTIKWDDWYKSFIVLMGETKLKTGISTLADVEKWIDAKCKQKFKRIAVYHTNPYGNRFTKGEATSLIDSEYAWFVSVKGERSKVGINSLWVVNETNALIKNQVEDCDNAITRLENKIKDLVGNAVKLTAEMMTEEP